MRLYGNGTIEQQAERLCVDNNYRIDSIAKALNHACIAKVDINFYHDAHDALKSAIEKCVQQLYEDVKANSPIPACFESDKR